MSADTQRGECPQTIGVSVHRHSKRGLSADNRLGRASADTRRISIYLYRVHVHVIKDNAMNLNIYIYPGLVSPHGALSWCAAEQHEGKTAADKKLSHEARPERL